MYRQLVLRVLGAYLQVVVAFFAILVSWDASQYYGRHGNLFIVAGRAMVGV